MGTKSFSRNDRGYGKRDVRVSCRVSIEEWRLLSKLSEHGNFKTVAALMRDILARYSEYVIRKASEVRAHDLGAEIAAMFRTYENTGMDWCDDVNKRL